MRAAPRNPAAASPTLPATSGTTGTSQMMNWGEHLPEGDEDNHRPGAGGHEPPGRREAAGEGARTATERGRLEHSLHGRESIRDRAGEVLRAVRRDHRRLVEAELMGGEEQGGAEALDLQRPVELARDRVPQAVGGDEHERDDHHCQRRSEGAKADRGLPSPVPAGG